MESNMEMKWLGIMSMVMILGMFASIASIVFASIALENHYKAECRIVALQAGKNSTDIAAICK